MTISVSPSQSQVQIALRAFLVAILPSSVAVVRGQDNRVPEPAGSDFVVMTPIRRDRLETNIDATLDGVFTGSIAGTVLTITQVKSGSLAAGSPLFGVGLATGSNVVALGTGTGGVGTYVVAPPQTIGSQLIASGYYLPKQPSKIAFQLDVHGPNSSDNAQTISTLMRDDFAFQQFLTSGFDVVPLYADDPKQVPFINAEQQYETRWVVEAAVQANQIVEGIPQQFADKVVVTPVNVEAAYPAT